MIKLQCNHTRDSQQCPMQATDLLVWICQEGHLDEAPFCVGHATAWVKYQRTSGYTCMKCTTPLIEWGMIDTHQIPEDYPANRRFTKL